MKGIHTLVRLLSTGALVVVTACGGGNAAESDSAAAETAVIGAENIAIVMSGTLESGPTISGALAPEQEASVRAQVGGSVLQTLVDAGQAVRAGQTLARIEGGGLQDVFLIKFNNSASTIPRVNRSLRASTCRPVTCSGDM